ncbi:MAG: DUF2312 domain-containing protein [Candidatus Bruticola sp.]
MEENHTKFEHLEGTDAKLAAIVERIEALEEEKAGIAQDIKDVYSEAKIEGFDVKVLRRIISLRKMEPREREEQESLLSLYMQALGMYANNQQPN